MYTHINTCLCVCVYIYIYIYIYIYMDFLGVSEGKESTCNTGDPGWILALGRSPGAGLNNSLQYS